MITDTTLTHAIAYQARVSPEALALAFLTSDRPPTHISFGTLHADARAAAARLRQEGIAPGDLVVLAGEHDYPSIVALVGAFYAGAVPAVYPYVSSYGHGPVYRQRLTDLVRDLRVRAVLASRDFPQDVAESLGSRGCRVVSMDVSPAAAGETFQLHEADAGSPAYIQFSSGTTGEPTGAVISHRAALAQAAACVAALDFRDDDILAGWLPLFHDLGLSMQLLLALVTGRPLVTMAPRLWVRQPLLLLQAVRDYRATRLLMPNFGYAHLTRAARERDLEALDLGNLRWLGTGGELVQASTLERFTSRFSGCGLRPNIFAPGYGLAECTSGLTLTPRGRGHRIDFVSRRALVAQGRATPVSAADADATAVVGCGVPFPGVTLTIVDAAERPLPDRHVGEILVDAPFTFDGYLLRPDLTSEVLRNGRVSTGDLGYRVGDELFVVDRKKDLIIAAGVNIYPDTVERIAREAVGDPGARAAAFAVRDEDAGTERPVVVCEVRGRVDDVRDAELTRRIRQSVDEAIDVPLVDVALVPRGWIVKTTSGKIARRATRQKYLEMRPRAPIDAVAMLARRLGDAFHRPSSPERQNVLEEAVRLFCEERLGRAPFGRADDFFALGSDSIRIVQLLLEVEQATGQALPVQYVLECPSVARLVETLTGPIQSASPDALRLAATGSRPTGLAWLPGLVGRRILCIGAGWGWVQRRRFPEQVALVRRMVRDAGAQGDAAVVRRSVIGNVLQGWSRRRPLVGNTWPRRTSGAEHLREALERKQPVVLLVSHTVGFEASVDLLQEQGVEPVLIGRAGPRRRAGASLEDAHDQDPRLRMFTSQLHAAVQALRQGGVAVVAGDGYQGRTGITLPFLGRQRRFGTGFAELALQTDALVLPVFTRVDSRGCLRLHVQEALAAPTGQDREPVAMLIRQYVGRLSAWWARYPDSVVWRHVGRFLALSTEDPAAS